MLVLAIISIRFWNYYCYGVSGCGKDDHIVML